MPTAKIFDIYRGTSHDGPGVRSTVFFAGCPLACGWCHNPEGIPMQNLVWWQPQSCIGCKICLQNCPNGALSANTDGIYISEASCVKCGKCVKACPTGALAFTADSYRISALINEVARDKAYYNTTGGGVTASGGECLLQHEFVAEFFKQLHGKNINTALDTSGHVPQSTFEKVLPHTDYILYDIKIMDDKLHKEFTGQSNSLILENIKWIGRALQEKQYNAEMWVRTPLIPNATATKENIEAIAGFIKTHLAGVVARWELCAFNNSCTTKYQRLQKPWKWQNTPFVSKALAAEMLMAAKCSGLKDEEIAVTGIIAE